MYDSITTKMELQPENLWQRLLYYALLTRFDKPIGIYLLMWPMLWALWISSEGNPDLLVTIVFVLGVIVMRAAGCIINDLADKNLDAQVQRTQFRPLAIGAITNKEAISLFILLCTVALFLVLLMNVLTAILSLVAIILAVIYPYMKRYTYMPQAFLGLAFGWAVPMTFAAQTNTLPEIAWLLLTATVLWATAYDTMYAMVDREDDIKVGIKSTAILFGEADRLIIASIQFMFFITMLIVGNKLNLGMWYYLGLLGAVCSSLFQQFLIKDRDPKNCLRAFLNNNWFGALIFAGLFVHYLTQS